MTAAMKPSLVLQKLRSGEKVSCFKVNLADAWVVELAALSGLFLPQCRSDQSQPLPGQNACR
ncbi:hypothetical protein [Cyclobacterium salsum]|uniref:hypothetical protein n=1 Tax=Cyclobacterium salsum TaxID=2666329 RepID=UPI001F2703BE|nr:hypothetical protein [Cyclobacterium salsum]